MFLWKERISIANHESSFSQHCLLTKQLRIGQGARTCQCDYLLVFELSLFLSVGIARLDSSVMRRHLGLKFGLKEIIGDIMTNTQAVVVNQLP